jgi:hypothetical protein
MGGQTVGGQSLQSFGARSFGGQSFGGQTVSSMGLSVNANSAAALQALVRQGFAQMDSAAKIELELPEEAGLDKFVQKRTQTHDREKRKREESANAEAAAKARAAKRRRVVTTEDDGDGDVVEMADGDDGDEDEDEDMEGPQEDGVEPIPAEDLLEEDEEVKEARLERERQLLRKRVAKLQTQIVQRTEFPEVFAEKLAALKAKMSQKAKQAQNRTAAASASEKMKDHRLPRPLSVENINLVPLAREEAAAEGRALRRQIIDADASNGKNFDENLLQRELAAHRVRARARELLLAEVQTLLHTDAFDFPSTEPGARPPRQREPHIREISSVTGEDSANTRSNTSNTSNFRPDLDTMLFGKIRPDAAFDPSIGEDSGVFEIDVVEKLLAKAKRTLVRERDAVEDADEDALKVACANSANSGANINESQSLDTLIQQQFAVLDRYKVMFDPNDGAVQGKKAGNTGKTKPLSSFSDDTQRANGFVHKLQCQVNALTGESRRAAKHERNLGKKWARQFASLKESSDKVEKLALQHAVLRHENTVFRSFQARESAIMRDRKDVENQGDTASMSQSAGAAAGAELQHAKRRNQQLQAEFAQLSQVKTELESMLE